MSEKEIIGVQDPKDTGSTSTNAVDKSKVD